MERVGRYVGQRPAAATPTEVNDETPALYVDGRPVTRAEMWERMTEVSGAAMLDEVVLDRRLEAACREADIEITDADLEREEALFLDALGDTGVSRDSETAARMLEQVRRTRGLGPVRYDALLRRSAMLRRLVASDVNVTEAAARLAWNLRYGPRRQVRLITTSTSRDAQQVSVRLRGGEPFEVVASETSTDISASRGGLLEPMHLDDASYPAAVRRVIGDLAVGETSSPIALEEGFAIVKVIADVPAPPGAPEFTSVEPAMRREARLVQERLLMARLASELTEGANLRIEDPGLRRVR
ncbi:MAG: peptidylprolyl isomerase [Phycisphaerales bacterium]|nr:peptidylprolyl isomerase [Phycisphaerales bacterium]